MKKRAQPLQKQQASMESFSFELMFFLPFALGMTQLWMISELCIFFILHGTINNTARREIKKKKKKFANFEQNLRTNERIKYKKKIQCEAHAIIIYNRNWMKLSYYTHKKGQYAYKSEKKPWNATL